jgi:hypothetical protein
VAGLQEGVVEEGMGGVEGEEQDGEGEEEVFQ